MSKRPTQNLNSKSNIALEVGRMSGQNTRISIFDKNIEPGQCHYGGGEAAPVYTTG